MSVSRVLELCLRAWRSSRYLRISPLHREFQVPRTDSILIVLPADPKLSLGFRQATYQVADGTLYAQ